MIQLGPVCPVSRCSPSPLLNTDHTQTRVIPGGSDPGEGDSVMGRREELAEKQKSLRDAPFFSRQMKDPPWVRAGPFFTEQGEEWAQWQGFFLVVSPAGKWEGAEKESHGVSGRGKRKQDCWAAVGT